jgi:hypothetical protein
MIKKNWILIFVALLLAGVYVFYFTGWFTPRTIHITSINARTSRAMRANNPNADLAAVPILFKLGRPCKLTELKVVALDEWQADKNCLPLWHLLADTNSVPISEPFIYGQKIRGMKPEVPGAHAQPLKPGVKYRLFVTDGSAKGEHDFQPVARPAGQ